MNYQQDIACPPDSHYGSGGYGQGGYGCRNRNPRSTNRSMQKPNKKCPRPIDNPSRFIFWKAIILNLVASYFLIFPIGSIDSQWTGIDDWAIQLGKALGYGFVLAVVLSATAPVTGGWLHPGNTLVALLVGKVGFLRGFLYIAVQFVGALLAYLHLSYLETPANLLASLPVPAAGLTCGLTLSVEFVATFLFVIFIWHIAVGYGSLLVYRKKRTIGSQFPAALAAGLALALAAWFSGLYSGAGINPWRYLAAAVFTGFGSCAWVYLVSGFVAPFVAYLVFVLFTGPSTILESNMGC